MTKIELGAVGAVITPSVPGWVEAAVELEELGYATVWLTGGQISGLAEVAEVIRATSRVKIGTGILSVDRFAAPAVNDLFTELEAEHPGRFVVGLGGAHGAKPIATLNAYLDELTAVPVGSRLLAALGPRMLELARERTAGAYPVLVTPEYVKQARALLGEDSTLALMQLVVVEPDPDKARAIARGPLGFLGSAPSYQASFRRMGFTDDEITPPSDRLADALVFRGDAAAVASQVREQLAAGADHVGVSVTSASPQTPLDQYRELAGLLLG